MAEKRVNTPNKAAQFDLWDDANAPKIEVLDIKMVRVTIPTGEDVRPRERAGVVLKVDTTDGSVELDRFIWFGVYGPKPGGAYKLSDPADLLAWNTKNDVWEYLREWEYVKMMPIGGEDAEYFATNKLLPELPLAP
jgi:hypothetical protein